MKVNHKLIFLIVSLLLAQWTLSQRSEKYDGAYAPFYKAEDLFIKEQYSAAKKGFQSFIGSFKDKNDPQFIKARYYHALSALELYNNDALQLLTAFNNDYPENIYKHTIYYRIGVHLYQTKKYEDALEWFEKTDLRDLDSSYVNEYYFKVGYAHFQLENFTAARDAFFEVKESESNYAAPALYYFSHIAYHKEAYQIALEGFLKLLDNESFRSEVVYYITQIYYMQGQYKALIDFAPQKIEAISKANINEMNKLIGDAYYHLERYDEAVSYLEKYHQAANTTREENYQLGYAYFQSTYYRKAIKKFDSATKGNDRLSQVALYHIAESYAKINELNNARSAFQRAAEINEDAEIQEDALYNFAVISYKLDYNPYNEAIRAFELFLDKFPNSERKNSVYEFLVNVYANTNNYDAALASLDRIQHKDVQLKSAYQIVVFNKGVSLFESDNYLDAINAFEKVNRFPVDPELIGKSLFWQADAHFMLGEHDKAIVKYRSFLSSPGNYTSELKHLAYYNIAYAYYEQEDYVQAIEAFRTFTQLPSNKDKKRLADAYIRIGDAYYVKKDPAFDHAAINYEKAVELKQNNQDRALFYLAKVYGFLPDKRQVKIATLLDIINNYRSSNYTVPAIYELGLSYKYEGKLDKGFEYFNMLIKDYPNNILVKDALIEIGDILYKQKKYDAALSYFNRVLKEYSLDDEKCKTATKGIQDIYRATRQQEKIVEIAEKYPCADISDDDQESFFYETANELYLNEAYDEAIPEIKKYLNAYPDGRFTTQLLSYLADIYYQRDEKGQALIFYEQIIEKPLSAYTEEALVRAAKTLYNDEKYERALPYYDQLEEFASSPQVVFNTRVGLMRCNFLLEFYNNAVSSAEKVLNDDKVTDRIRLEANYIAGIGAFKEEKYEKAIPYLKWTAENTGAERGAEAHHYLGEAHLYLENYGEAEDNHKEMMKRKPSYDFWVAKSLILQARIFMATDDLFQAESTIDLVLKNYPIEDDGVLLEANKFKSELMQLKSEPDKEEQNINRVIELENDED